MPSGDLVELDRLACAVMAGHDVHADGRVFVPTGGGESVNFLRLIGSADVVDSRTLCGAQVECFRKAQHAWTAHRVRVSQAVDEVRQGPSQGRGSDAAQLTP